MQTQRSYSRERRAKNSGHSITINDAQDPRYYLLTSREICDAEELCGPLQGDKRLAVVTDFPFAVRSKLLTHLMQFACQGPVENVSVVITAARNEFLVPPDALAILDDVVRATCEKISEAGLLLGYSLHRRDMDKDVPVMKAKFVLRARLRKIRRIGGRRLDDSDAIIVCGSNRPGPESARDENFDLPCFRAISALVKEMPRNLRLLHPLSPWRFQVIVGGGQQADCMAIVAKHGVAAKFSEHVHRRRL